MIVSSMLLYDSAQACFYMIPMLCPILSLLLLAGYIVFSVVNLLQHDIDLITFRN